MVSRDLSSDWMRSLEPNKETPRPEDKFDHDVSTFKRE